MANPEQAELTDRLKRMDDALIAQSRGIGLLMTNQKLEIEMLAKVLETVTSKPNADDDPLSKLLAQLVHASEEQTRKIDTLIALVRR